jgi:hypothetical protein
MILTLISNAVGTVLPLRIIIAVSIMEIPSWRLLNSSALAAGADEEVCAYLRKGTQHASFSSESQLPRYSSPW